MSLNLGAMKLLGAEPEEFSSIAIFPCFCKVLCVLYVEAKVALPADELEGITSATEPSSHGSGQNDRGRESRDICQISPSCSAW